MSGKRVKRVEQTKDPDPVTPVTSDRDDEVLSAIIDVDYEVQAHHNPKIADLKDFLNSGGKMINQPGAATTNIIDRRSGTPYNIPDNKIPKFFSLAEQCRRMNVNLMLNERQQEYSGIMLDFDIYQKADHNQITDETIHLLCKKIAEVLMCTLRFTERKETVYIGVIRRPKITYNEEKKSYKDGLHLIIPSVKVTKAAKKLIINKILDSELIERVLEEVEPADFLVHRPPTPGKPDAGPTGPTKYTRNDFLDKNSAHVPVFFVGSASKKGSTPYNLTHIYELVLHTELKEISVVLNTTMVTNPAVNIMYEFSLNYEAPSGTIKKKRYEVIEKYQADLVELAKTVKADEEADRNFGELSMQSIHDVRVGEIREILDILKPSRAENYNEWRDVLAVLAATSKSYKNLAEYFSRKSHKFNMPAFEKLWASLTGSVSNKKMLTIGSLHHWAKLDNEERYKALLKNQVYHKLYHMVLQPWREGQLSHADIAQLLHSILLHKFITDTPEGERKRVWYEFMLDNDDHMDGELYKWVKHTELPTSIARYVSDTLPNLFLKILDEVKRKADSAADDSVKFYTRTLAGFKGTLRKLGDRNFKKNVLIEAEDRFNRRGFAMSLDTDPLVRGVANGVLKLTLAAGGCPELIIGYHSYPVSRYTNTPYIAFNPYDPITKQILITLRNLFPDNEPDSFEFTMYYLSSSIDGQPKESMFMIMVGSGCNGKSFLVELHKGAIGETYAAKIPLSFLTGKSGNADNATPALMMLRYAGLAYYSESNQNEVLNAARIKEATGLETLAGRKLHQDMVNFKPRCHHLATTNYDFEIQCNDHGTWRRIEYNPLKIKFVDPSQERYNPSDPFQRIADDAVNKSWTEDPEIKGRYLGYMVWMNYWLYRRFRGKVKSVPHPHIEFETAKYRARQDTINAFLAQRFIKLADPDATSNMNEEIQKYIRWYILTYGNSVNAKGLVEQFQNSQVGPHIKTTARNLVIVGHRFLDNGDQLAEGEEYALKHVFNMAAPEDNFGIKNETSEEYYARVCAEYDRYKHLFPAEPRYNVDLSSCAVGEQDHEDQKHDQKHADQKTEEKTYDPLSGRVLPSGIVLRQLEEPSINYLTDEFHFKTEDYLINDEDVTVDPVD